MALKIRPLHDRVVIKRVDDERKTPGGIVIPDTASAEKPMRGKVIAVGNGKIMEDGKVRPLAVKIGDSVLFGKYSGTEVKIENEEYVVMKEDDIMGIIE